METFLEQRLQELSAGTDVIVMSLLQSAPAAVQSTDNELSSMLSQVSALSTELTSSELQQLMSIRNSPRYAVLLFLIENCFFKKCMCGGIMVTTFYTVKLFIIHFPCIEKGSLFNIVSIDTLYFFCCSHSLTLSLSPL